MSTQLAARQSPFRLDACASPIHLHGIDGFHTIEGITQVSFITPPTTLGTVEVDSPRGAICPGRYFSARFLSPTGWRRASFLAMAIREAPGMRDVVTLRMLAEPQPAAERAHSRTPIGIAVDSRIVQAAALPPDAAVSLTVIDASPGGVCVESSASLCVGDQLLLESPRRAEVGAEFEVLRGDVRLRNRYGGRFNDPDSGRAVFEDLVEAAADERARKVRVAADPERPASPDTPPQPRGGFRSRGD
jgi:hypothetical protein